MPIIDVIYDCITTCSMCVLWNGVPTKSFKPTRGIRQGDPLSPYIFVMCMERLAHVIEAAVSQKRWKPVTASRGGGPISNLMFADDLVLFAEASMGQVQVLKECLDRFCAASGQKINQDKSRIMFSSNMPDSEMQHISELIGIPAMDDLGMYLGCPLYQGK